MWQVPDRFNLLFGERRQSPHSCVARQSLGTREATGLSQRAKRPSSRRRLAILWESEALLKICI